MKRKLLSLVMAGAMVLSLAACTGGSNGNVAPANNGGGNNGDGTGAVTEIDPDAPITLDMWCIATESDSNRHSYEAAIADMAEKYPNITLNWEAFENESYKTKIKAGCRKGLLP